MEPKLTGIFPREVFLDAVMRADGWLLGFVVRGPSKDGTGTPYRGISDAQHLTIEIDTRWTFLRCAARRYERRMAERGRW